ncbi:MAG: FAD-dependent monooxygenase [Rhizobiales bacterium]|nr:FAD-dependent monooxygenase [Hyphomicrobiales bacterium]
MRETDIAIVGGGLAGATAAAMLGRAGVRAVLVDPHAAYPPDFRCEKLDASQVELLRKTGLAEAVLRAATPDGQVSIVRYGRLVDRRPNSQYDIFYDTLVNTIRAKIPDSIEVLGAKARVVSTGPDRQKVALSTGEEISARLVVMANGLNSALRQTMGMTRRDISKCHSISIGFDLIPVGRPSFDFRALTYYPASPADRLAYLTLFPIGATMRANCFVYRDFDDPWLRQLREAPLKTLAQAMPGLLELTGKFEVRGFIKIRPVDLYVTEGHRQHGIVLVGDAFATSCPAAGTGANKVFTDVERLCKEYIPQWLLTPGMGVEKVSAFYDDPAKQASDRDSAWKAMYLRSLSIDTALQWRARRAAKFVLQLGLGKLRRMSHLISTRPAYPDRPARAGGGSSVR